MDNIVSYNRQESIDAVLYRDYKDSMHFIIGCGGVGFWLGTLLSMMGAKYLWLMDGDKIEPTNLNRLPVPQSWIGINKAVALRKVIHFMRPLCAINVIARHVTPDTIDILDTAKTRARIGMSYVWDCTDDARIQRIIYTKAKASTRTKYIKIGYDGFNVGNHKTMDSWINEETYQTGYRSSVANAVTSAVTAGMGLYSMLSPDLSNVDDVNINLIKLMQEAKDEQMVN